MNISAFGPWVGAHGNSTGGWSWISGEHIPRSSDFWSSGNPKDDKVVRCAYMRENGMRATACHDKYPFVCQKKEN